MAVFPVNIDGIKYATAQLVAKRDGKIYMMQIPGIPTTIGMQNGKVLKNIKAKGLEKPVYENICLLTKQDAEHLFLNDTMPTETSISVTYTKVKEAGPLRQIPIGVQRVAEEPTDGDFEQAAVYKIQLPEAEAYSCFSSVAGEQTSSATPSSLLSITYQGDCARLYADGKLVADHFQYGRPFLFGLWRLPKECKELELRILPMQENAPIYLPREADKTPGEGIKSIIINK